MLGKRPAVVDRRTFKLSNYQAAALPPVPDQVDWAAKVGGTFPVYLNDRIGDCAVAMVAHQRRVWTANDAANMAQPTDDQVLQGYQRCGGYVPGNPSTDRGCVMLDVLNVWRREGLCGGRIGAYATVNPHDHHVLKFAINSFGGALLGVQLPAEAEGRDEWVAPDAGQQRGRWAKGSWGGHAITAVGYDAERIQFISWGKLMLMSWHFFDSYNDEAYVALSADWLGPDFQSPAGFDITVLLRDTKNIAGTV